MEKAEVIQQQPKLETETDIELFSRRWPIVLFLAIAVIDNLLLGILMKVSTPTTPSGIPVYASFGLTISQFCLLSFFLVMYPASVGFRLAVMFPFIFLTVGTLAVGFRFGETNDAVQIFQWVAAVPLLIVAFAIPFAVGKYILGWCFSAESESGLDCDRKPETLSIASMLLATAIIAFSFAILGLGDKTETLSRILAAAICCGIGFLFLLPMAGWMLRRNPSSPLLVLLFLIGIFAAFAVSYSMSGLMPGFNFWQLFGIQLSALSTLFWFGFGIKCLGSLIETGQTEPSLAND